MIRRGKQVHIPIKSLRKAHATWQAERGRAESVLQALMAHAKGSRMARKFYVQATDEAKRVAAIQLPTGMNQAQHYHANRKQGLAISGNRAQSHFCTPLAEIN